MNPDTFTRAQLGIFATNLGRLIGNFDRIVTLYDTEEGVFLRVEGMDRRYQRSRDSREAAFYIPYADLIDEAVCPVSTSDHLFHKVIDAEDRDKARKAREDRKRAGQLAKRRKIAARQRRAQRELATLQRLAAKHNVTLL